MSFGNIEAGINVKEINDKGFQHFYKNGTYGQDVVSCIIDHGFTYTTQVEYPYNVHGAQVKSVIQRNCPNIIVKAYELTAQSLGFGDTKKKNLSDYIEEVLLFAKQDKRPVTVNMSLTSPRDDYVYSLIQELVSIGVPVICAAGNDNINDFKYPASYPEAISVAAIDNSGKKADFSNYNDLIDFCNLGVGVDTTHIENGKTVKQQSQGTSFATPNTNSQYNMLVCDHYRRYKERMKEDVLYELAKSLCIDLGNIGYDQYTGYGLIDLSKYKFGSVTIPVPEVPQEPPKEEPKQEEPMRNLKLTSPYMKGEDVKALQQRLADLGYLPQKEVDGVFGPKTETAVKAFQKDRGLTADGIAGPKTQAALGADPVKPDPVEPVSDFINGLVLFVLSKLGFLYVWGADGQKNISESWIRKMDTSESNAQRSITFWNKLKSQGVTDIEAYDCSGLISRYLEDNGKVSSKRNCDHLWAMCKEIKRADLQPGDLLFRGTPKDFYHVGVYVGSGRVVEAKGRDDGVVIRGIDASGSSYWKYYGRLNIK